MADRGFETIYQALVRMGMMDAGARPRVTPLTGGVSSDICRVDLPGGSICIKRALPQLRVEKEWIVPVERTRFEVDWLRRAADIVADAVPAVLGEDRQAGLFAMPFLPPETHPVWKHQLRDGDINPATASSLGQVLARLHGATANRPAIAAAFADAAPLFHALRLDAYLLAAGREHPDYADVLERLVARTAETRRVLVHGDVSPKNILVGPAGPVLLDAETACYGDPAFDLAFCLNHLLLKCVWRPRWTDQYLDCFDALVDAYRSRITWEARVDLEARASSLLPGLLLARIDGKSPVEYITDESDKNRVRHFAFDHLAALPDALKDVRDAWRLKVSS